MKQHLYKAKSLIIIMIMVSMLISLGGIAYVKHIHGEKAFVHLSDHAILGNSSQNEKAKTTLSKNQFSELLQQQSKSFFYGAIIAGTDSYALLFTDDMAPPLKLKTGQMFSQRDFREKTNTVLIREGKKADCDEKSGELMATYAGKDYKVIGVYSDTDSYGNQNPDYLFNYKAENLDDQILNTNFIFDSGNDTRKNLDAITEVILRAYEGMYLEYTESDSKDAGQFQVSGSNFESMLMLWVMTAILILLNSLSACSNWINGKKKEIAVRKMVGANRSHIRRWLYSEFFLIICVSFAIGLFLSKIFLFITPYLPVAESTQMMFGTAILWQGVLLGFAVMLLLGTAVISINLHLHNKKAIVRNIK